MRWLDNTTRVRCERVYTATRDLLSADKDGLLTDELMTHYRSTLADACDALAIGLPWWRPFSRRRFSRVAEALRPGAPR